MARSVDIYSTTRIHDDVIVVGTLTSTGQSAYSGSVTVAVPDQLQRQVRCLIVKTHVGGSWLIYVEGELIGNAATLQTASKALGNELQRRGEQARDNAEIGPIPTVAGNWREEFHRELEAAQAVELTAITSAGTISNGVVTVVQSYEDAVEQDQLDRDEDGVDESFPVLNTWSSASRQHFIDTGSYVEARVACNEGEMSTKCPECDAEPEVRCDADCPESCSHRPDDEGDAVVCRDCRATLTFVGGGAGDGGSDYDAVESVEKRIHDEQAEASKAAQDAAIVAAAREVADVFIGALGFELGVHLSCSEADTVAKLLRALGETESTVTAFLTDHAAEDDEGDEHWSLVADEDGHTAACEAGCARSHL